jgi:hypothetical protein
VVREGEAEGSPVDGLGDLVDGHHAESLVEGNRLEAALLEDVRERLQAVAPIERGRGVVSKRDWDEAIAAQ